MSKTLTNTLGDNDNHHDKKPKLGKYGPLVNDRLLRIILTKCDLYHNELLGR